MTLEVVLYHQGMTENKKVTIPGYLAVHVCVCAHTHACAHACMCTCVGEFERAKGSGAISSCIISEEKRKEDFKEVFFVRCKFNFF